jgi:hypothetical protein
MRSNLSQTPCIGWGFVLLLVQQNLMDSDNNVIKFSDYKFWGRVGGVGSRMFVGTVCGNLRSLGSKDTAVATKSK